MVAAWQRKHPRSLRHAMELCLAYAREVNRFGVERVADRMGLASHWTLYKWMESGRLPAILIRPFEAATGADFVTRWLAASDHKLLIDIPAGRAADETQTSELQVLLAETTRLVVRHYQAGGDAEAAVGSIRNAIAALGWHHENIERSLAPELDLEGGRDE